MYDIITVGGGISGLHCAHLAAKEGFKVALVEAHGPKKKKACGEFVNLRIKGKKKIFDFKKSFSKEIYNTIALNRIESFYIRMGGKSTLYKSNLLSIEKDTFHDHLIDECISSGVDIFHNCRVNSVKRKKKEISVSSTNKELNGQIVIGADGCHSKIRENISPSPRYIGFAVSALSDTPNHPEMENLMDFDTIEKGYVWCGRHGDKYNIGLGSTDIKDVWQMWKETFGKKKGIDRIRGAHVLLSPVKKLIDDKCMLIGEAGGLLGYTTGAGISTGLFSAEIAIPFVKNYLETGQHKHLEHYGKEVKRELSPFMSKELWVQRYIFATQKVGLFKPLSKMLLPVSKYL